MNFLLVFFLSCDMLAKTYRMIEDKAKVMKNSNELLDKVFKSCQDVDGRKSLTCAKAFQLAKEFDVAIIEIGKLCNDNSIRICNCQLGCFQ